MQGIQQLVGNKLRTFLSLLGITIGIFCIVAVQSAIDSMKNSILSSFEELGSDVLYIDKNPWAEEGGNNRRKYQKYPAPTYEEYLALKKKVSKAEQISFCSFANVGVMKFNSSSVEGSFVMGPTEDYADISNLKFDKGRYFTRNEIKQGQNKVILGKTLAEELFQDIEPIGKIIKVFGSKYQVVGIISENGDNLFSIMPYDIVAMVPFNNLKTVVNVSDERNGRILNLTPKPGVSMDELKDEIITNLRSNRLLKPLEENNFFINNITMLQNILNKIFGVMGVVGLIIGIFALIVGLFSVANIMFVSVKERTPIIGIKKALGAKRYIILMEILTESIILCIIGGLMGMGLVVLVLKIVSSVTPYSLNLTPQNAAIGVGMSILTGVIAGFLPAYSASKLDPVEAMRS